MPSEPRPACSWIQRPIADVCIAKFERTRVDNGCGIEARTIRELLRVQRIEARITDAQTRVDNAKTGILHLRLERRPIVNPVAAVALPNRRRGKWVYDRAAFVSDGH